MISEREKSRRKRTKQKRNQKIVNLYDTGNYTMKELADRFGITKQRVGQITKRAGINGNLIQKQRARERRVRKRKIEVECAGCGNNFKKTPKSDKSYCTIDCFRENGTKTNKYSDQDLIAHAVSVKEKHGEISTETLAYEEPPSYNTLFRRLGSIETIKELITKGQTDE